MSESKTPKVETAAEERKRLDPRNKPVAEKREDARVIDLDNAQSEGRLVDKLTLEATPKKTTLNTVTGTMREDR